MQAHAVREYRAALARTPDHRESMIQLAGLYADRQDYTRAIDVYEAFLERYPSISAVDFLLANVHLAAGHYREAIARYESLVQRRPHWAELHGRLGYAYVMSSQPAPAVSAYRRTLEIRPDSSLVRYQLARLYEAQDNPDAAMAQYDTLVDADPGDARYHTLLADLLIRRAGQGGDYSIDLPRNSETDAAEEHLRMATRLAPGRSAAFWSLGMVLARQARYREAQVQFERLLELEPDNPDILFCLANLNRRTGLPAEAEEYMSRYRSAATKRRLERRAKEAAGEQLEKIFGSLPQVPPSRAR